MCPLLVYCYIPAGNGPLLHSLFNTGNSQPSNFWQCPPPALQQIVLLISICRMKGRVKLHWMNYEFIKKLTVVKLQTVWPEHRLLRPPGSLIMVACYIVTGDQVTPCMYKTWVVAGCWGKYPWTLTAGNWKGIQHIDPNEICDVTSIGH